MAELRARTPLDTSEPRTVRVEHVGLWAMHAFCLPAKLKALLDVPWHKSSHMLMYRASDALMTHRAAVDVNTDLKLTHYTDRILVHSAAKKMVTFLLGLVRTDHLLSLFSYALFALVAVEVAETFWL